MSVSLLRNLPAGLVRRGDTLPEFGATVAGVAVADPGRVQLDLTRDGGLTLTVTCNSDDVLQVARPRRVAA